jgi:hypothetical protein
MRSWKENHYSRGTQFVQLLAEAIGGTAPAAAPAATPAGTAPRPQQSAPSPKPAAPTTAAVFKSIPWKK